MIKQLYIKLGRFLYRWGLPLIRRLIGRSKRAYVLALVGSDVLVINSWLSDGLWYLPGGGIKTNETAEATIRRELQEELDINLASGHLKLLKTGRWSHNRLNFEYHIFITRLARRPSLRLRRWEIMNAQWVNLELINQTNTPADILEAIKAAGLKPV